MNKNGLSYEDISLPTSFASCSVYELQITLNFARIDRCENKQKWLYLSEVKDLRKMCLFVSFGVCPEYLQGRYSELRKKHHWMGKSSGGGILNSYLFFENFLYITIGNYRQYQTLLLNKLPSMNSGVCNDNKSGMNRRWMCFTRMSAVGTSTTEEEPHNSLSHCS
jgi:hypothetical protein